MSRSRRKSPCTGATTARSEKAWKRELHQRERAAWRRWRQDALGAVEPAQTYSEPWDIISDAPEAFDGVYRPPLADILTAPKRPGRKAGYGNKDGKVWWPSPHFPTSKLARK